jgi:hypothetical protein
VFFLQNNKEKLVIPPDRLKAGVTYQMHLKVTKEEKSSSMSFWIQGVYDDIAPEIYMHPHPQCVNVDDTLRLIGRIVPDNYAKQWVVKNVTFATVETANWAAVHGFKIDSAPYMVEFSAPYGANKWVSTGMEISVNAPPVNGVVTVEPNYGTEFEQYHVLRTFNWSDEEKNYPLKYQYTLRTSLSDYTISTKTTSHETIALLPGPTGGVTIIVEASDSLGAVATAEVGISLSPISEMLPEGIKTKLLEVVADSLDRLKDDDMIQAPAVIAALSVRVFSAENKNNFTDDDLNGIISRMLGSINSFLTEFDTWPGGYGAVASMIEDIMTADVGLND